MTSKKALSKERSDEGNGEARAYTTNGTYIGPAPDKPGIYRTEWENGGQYLNVFDGTYWCWGTGHKRDIKSFEADVGWLLLKNRGEHVASYLTPFAMVPTDGVLVSFEPVVIFGE